MAIAFAEPEPEPEREAFLRAIQISSKSLISTVCVVETRMVVHCRRGQRAVILVDDLLRLPMFELLAPGPAEMDAAYAAFVAYGKGSGYPAGLNFGDVFSYALAKVRGLPQLYKGADFAQTDIGSAPAQQEDTTMSTETATFFDGRITIDPEVCNGKPAIRGKRIAARTILEFLGAGETAEEILKQYPSLEPDDIRACLKFAALLMDNRYDLAKAA